MVMSNEKECSHTLRVEVVEQLLHPAGSTRVLLRNSLPLSLSLKFDYDTLVSGIKLLYSNKPNLIINLTIFV